MTGLLDEAGREVRGSVMGLEIKCLTGAAVVRVACGAAHSVCVLASGEVLSWGCGKGGRVSQLASCVCAAVQAGCIAMREGLVNVLPV